MIRNTTNYRHQELKRTTRSASIMVFNPSPRSEWKMISQGAEARVWKLPMASSDDTIPNDDNNDDDNNDTNSNSNNNDDHEHTHNHGFIVCCKERFAKAYRHPELDAKLTKSRCRSEAKILEKCTTKSKIRVPKVIRISPPDLYLEYLTGPSVKRYLQEERQKDQQQQKKKDENGEDAVVVEVVATTIITKSNILDLAQQIGQLVGRLHNIGIVHGDLTTSNMMVLEVNDDSSNKSESNNDDKKEDGSSSSSLSSSLFEVALIDFGLSKSTFSVEEQAVDLYVLERALLSTHPELPENFFDHILEQYSSTTTMSAADDDENNNDNSKKRKNLSQTTLQRLEQVRMRGRKRECFG